MAGIPPGDLALQEPAEGAQVVGAVLSPTGSITPVSTPTTPSALSPEGMYCYGNERQALADQTRFFNNELLSDVVLKVGEQKFFGHKLILVRASDVFERMFSASWHFSHRREVDLVEEESCIEYFSRFLKFLYGCQVLLSKESCLPVLVLADKYNVQDLRSVCINFACTHIIPKLQLKGVFHTWFQYATKCYHTQLVSACVLALSTKMTEITLSEEWSQEWIQLDKDQLIEFLKSSDLCVRNEFELWKAVLKWLQSTEQEPGCLENNLRDILPHIRFPMMSPDQLCQLEKSKMASLYPDMFQPILLEAYKYHALSLTSRSNNKNFVGPGFLLRNYSELRWDKRLVLTNYATCQRFTEVSLRFSTRSSSYPSQNWDWELKIYPKGFSQTSDEFRCILYSNLILDQPRPIEYYLAIVNKAQTICFVTGRKTFSKNRYTVDTEIDKQLSVADLSVENSPFLVDGSIVLQIVLRPLD